MILCKEFTFDSAHQLKNYVGNCANLHGHTYRLQISIQGPVQENGLVLDFKELKKHVKKNVLDIIDHKYLNDVIDQPSAENIAIWIWKQLKDSLPLYEIKLWETPTSFVIYSE